METHIEFIRQYMRSLAVPWTEDGLEELVYAFETKTLAAGDFFLKEGQVCRSIALVHKGCLRLYTIDDGEEKSLFFFPERYFCADSRSYLSGKPARCFIDALEECELLTLSGEKVRELGQKYRDVETCNRALLAKLLVSAENRVMLHVLSNPEARYKRLLEDFGSLVNRVPQKYLASFLGITPVSLSRIRARMAQAL